MSHKLLLADDSVTIQRIIELTFADEDIEVITVGDGQQAIDRIERDRPDIVLADVGMAERDGYEVAAFVKEHPATGQIPVLLLAGPFEPVDETRARAIGCEGILVKPFEPPVLVDRVRDVLAGRRPESLWPTPPAVVPPAEPSSVVRVSAPAPAAEAKPVRAARTPKAKATPARVARVRARVRTTPPEPARAVPSSPPPAEEEPAPLPLPESPAVAVAPEPAAARDEEADAKLHEYLDQLDARLSAVTEGEAAPTPRLPPGEAEAPSRKRAEKRGAFQAPVEDRPRVAESLKRPVPRPKDASRAARRRARAAAAAQGLASQTLRLTPAEQGPSSGVALATDALVEAVTERVLQRIGDEIVRKAVTDAVTEVTERVMRKEIKRTKKAAD